MKTGHKKAARKPRMPAQSLRQVRTEADLIWLRRDNYARGDFSILVSETTVWLSEQKMGAARTQSIQIPKGVFDRLIDMYVRPQKRSKS